MVGDGPGWIAMGRTGVGVVWPNLNLCGICKEMNLSLTMLQRASRLAMLRVEKMFHKEMNLQMPIAHAVVLRRVGDGPAC